MGQNEIDEYGDVVDGVDWNSYTLMFNVVL